MRFIKKQFSSWRLLLIVGVAAIAIPIASGVRPTAIAADKEQQDYLNHQTTALDDGASAKHSKDSEVIVGPVVARPQDYYDRRREYWEKRVERRLDEEEGDDNGDEKEDSDAKDNKADKDDGDDEDEVEQEVEQRREYWRKRVERDW